MTSTARRGDLAEALPVPLEAFKRRGLLFRRGQMSLTVAAPGVGKSQLWQNIAARTHVPVLFFSADTDRHDVLTRTLALMSGHTIEEVLTMIEDPAWAPTVQAALEKAGHVEWVFDPAISGQYVGERMNAFAEVHGEYPHLVVIDVLKNCAQDLEGQTAAMAAFQRLARESGAHVAVLTHAKGEYGNGMRRIPLGGVLNNLDKDPEVVVTLSWATAGKWLSAVVAKNRSGDADPAAENPMTLQVDYSRARVEGFA